MLGGRLITLIRDNITFATTDIPSTIYTHNIEPKIVKVHITITKHITITTIYIPPQDVHPRTAQQLAWTYSTSQTYHTPLLIGVIISWCNIVVQFICKHPYFICDSILNLEPM